MARVVLTGESADARFAQGTKIMLDISGFEAGSVAVALTGAVLGWSLRPIFLRYRRAFVVAVAVLAAAGATAYDAFDAKLAPQQVASSIVRSTPLRIAASPPTAVAAASSSEPWADYLERAGRDAFADRDYDSAARYWRDASRLSPRHAAELADAIAHAHALGSERL